MLCQGHLACADHALVGKSKWKSFPSVLSSWGTEGTGFVAVIFKFYLPEPTLRVLRMLKWEALLTLGL